MKILRTRGGVSPMAILIAALAFAHNPAAEGQDDLTHLAHSGPQLSKTLTQEATTYFDLPLQKLKDAVPALKGLKYDPSQDRMAQILAGVAARIADVLPRLPNLVSREDVYHFQSAPDSGNAGGLASMQPWSREFRYLIVPHHAPDGSTTLEESRVDSKGRPTEASEELSAPRGYGFAYQWLFFSAAFQPEFRFRYLGEQDKGGRKTFAVAFTQQPAKVSNPARFESDGKVAPFYFQGVLWVDQSSFDIVMVRTDLLAPLPDLHLRQLSTQLTFRAVPIHGYDAVFWLPSEAYISSDQGSGAVEESHRYSDYHLYHSTARILPSP
ncbi:MAG: hypothetical protein ABSF53_11610 [Terracidiphilus sp.]